VGAVSGGRDWLREVKVSPAFELTALWTMIKLCCVLLRTAGHSRTTSFVDLDKALDQNESDARHSRSSAGPLCGACKTVWPPSSTVLVGKTIYTSSE